MSAPALRALSSRAGPLSTSSHQSVACQRLAARSYGSYSATLTPASVRSRLRNDANSIQPPFALRSHFLPSTISAAAVPGVRHVSFKEMREQRAREAAAGGKKEDPKSAKTKKRSAEPEAEAAPAEPEHSAADDAFAQFKRDSDASWFKSRKAQQEQQEQQQQQQQEEAEGGEGAEEGGEKKKQEQKEQAAPPPHGEKTPWQVFTETLQTEFKASKEWNEGTKQLGGSIHDFTQNPNVQRARTVYSKGVETAASTTGKVIMGTAGAIGKSAAWTWDTPVAKVIRKGAGAVGSGVEKATRPVRETEAYRNVKDVIDDGSSQKYGGWTEREERRKKREARDLKMGFDPNRSTEPLEEDPDAGTNVTVHKDSAWKESWKSFRDSNPMMQRLFTVGSVYRESEKSSEGFRTIRWKLCRTFVGGRSRPYRATSWM